MINISAYDTTVCASLAIRKVTEELERAGIVGCTDLMHVTTGKHETPFDLYAVAGGNSFADAVPFFKHPVLVSGPEGEHGANKAFVVDIRDFGKWSTPHYAFVVRNPAEYAWTLRRAVLNQIWMDGRPETLRDLSTLPASTYQALVSECVARRFALDPSEQMTVSILAAYFYYGLFTDEVEFSDTEKALLSGKIGGLTRIPAAQVMKTLEGLPVLHGLESMVNAIKDKVQNPALENFNIGTLLAVVCSTWFGNNSREVVAVGLEHIPTWLCLISSSLESAVFKRSPLAKIAQRFDKAGAGDNFVRSLEVIMGGAHAVTNKDGKIDSAYETYFNA
jgi:hypothetical protein